MTDEEWILRTKRRATLGLEPHVHPTDNLGVGPVVLYLRDTQVERRTPCSMFSCSIQHLGQSQKWTKVKMCKMRWGGRLVR